MKGNRKAHGIVFQSHKLDQYIHPAFRKGTGLSLPENPKFNEASNLVVQSECLKKLGKAVQLNFLLSLQLEPTNPLALQMPLHQAEKIIIPIGLELGWPSWIDWDQLRLNNLGQKKGQSVLHEMGTFDLEQPGYHR
ncbi:uncharacterized protein VP01_5775g3 [Puccinia sorghi]|uniref:Uncharacterized protein n=1 Tax=Puccinia sorghi TaxID=27349 RepID=A0A0L6UJ28_9BASI|nr:uncharacterized protein VP01_5775g3 [Puccinia sorghi]